MVRAVVGGNWGDEGKGKIIDYLAEKADVVVRFQGGANAGHTIINQYGRFALHLLPSGSFCSNVTNVIGQGVALDIDKLFKEIDSIISQGVPMPKLLISDRAQVLMPYHILFDELEEVRLGKKNFGSTKSGIAPFYSDKYLKIGIQVGELFFDDVLKERLDKVCELKNNTIKGLYPEAQMIDPVKLFDKLVGYREKLKPLVGNTTLFIQTAIRESKEVLIEGQLGSLKDTDNGIYPFVTSSSPLAGFASVGAGIPPYCIKQIIVVTKAYSSAVGAGAFVSEIFGDEAEDLRKRGGDKGEYGATTGRPRRVGWFDAVASKYGCMLQGATDVCLSLIDVLGYLDKIPVCVGYDIDGIITDEFPITPLLDKAKPVFEYLDGWKCDIRGIKIYNDLPENAKKYVDFIESKLGYPITMVSNGPKREEMLSRKSNIKVW
ncbi:MAG: adenylosuccinate synthase [Clostridiales bacterium GWF2_38_85]|nr:MAG: adenylosuccinate synthase [Clostridiales bacterium GWF2_38_85]HBL83659.1 adenylosuccinate synthase [Clostridiales bacterium]